MYTPVQFEEGMEYLRKKLHDAYGGQRQGGISTPRDHKIIMLFDTSSGNEYGYRDGFTEDGVYEWTGEGQIGVMTLSRGNKAIHSHLEEGREIHLFKGTNPGWVKYIGEMVSLGYFLYDGVDKNGDLRKIIVFNLAPINTSHDRLVELRKKTNQQIQREPKKKPQRITQCPRCQTEYSWEDFDKSRFCKNCGSYLARKIRYE